MEELRSGSSWGVHSWVEDASGEGRRVSWFVPQNQGGGRRLKTPSRGGTGVSLGTSGGDGRRRRLGPRCGRGGDGRRAASRAIRRPRRERRLGPRRGGGNLPRVRFWWFSQNRPPTRVSRTLQNRGPVLRRRGGIAAKTSSRRKKLRHRLVVALCICIVHVCILHYLTGTSILVYIAMIL